MILSDIEWFALETNRDRSVIFEIASKYCILDSFVDHNGYSISSKGFLPSNYHTIALTSQASKVMLKIPQARLQQYMNCEIPDIQAGFRKSKGTRDQIANIHWMIKKAREYQKNIYFCFIDYAKAFNCVDHNKLWKILKEMGIQTCMQVRKQKLELDMEQQTGSK